MLRGVAIVCVLLLHFSLAYGLQDCPLRSFLSLDQLRAIFYNGNYGVTVFFVISGYLITTLSVSRWGRLDRIDPRRFYLYRFARIMPCLCLALFIITAPGCLHVPYFDNTDDGHALPTRFFIVAVASVQTFWHNLLMQSAGWFNYCLNIYWSLSVEEVFYLALPLVCLTLRRGPLLIAASIALIVYAPIYRSNHSGDEIFYECANFACFDAIALGFLAALASRRWKITGGVGGTLRILSVFTFCVVYLRGIDGHQTFGFSWIALCTAVYLFCAANDAGPTPATRRLTAPIRWLGRDSYELYLFHIIILAGMRNLVDRGRLPHWAWAPWLVLFLALSAAFAHLVSTYFSAPANASFRRLA